MLTHGRLGPFGRITSIYASVNWVISVLGIDLPSVGSRAITWTSVVILSIGFLVINSNQNTQKLPFKKMYLEISSSKCIVPVNALSSDGARPSAGTVMITKWHIFATEFLSLPVILNYICWPHGVIKMADGISQNLAKLRVLIKCGMVEIVKFVKLTHWPLGDLNVILKL